MISHIKKVQLFYVPPFYGGKKGKSERDLRGVAVRLKREGGSAVYGRGERVRAGEGGVEKERERVLGWGES